MYIYECVFIDRIDYSSLLCNANIVYEKFRKCPINLTKNLKSSSLINRICILLLALYLQDLYQ